MQAILAIIKLTWKAAFRYRLFWVLAVLLLATVVLLPLLIKDDGTARGFTQILLTYTLTLITALLGLSTLWLACGTLARDIEEAQIQMIVVKPVARWQIWIGKWLGLVLLNAALLAVAGASVFVLLQYRATKLPAPEQAILRDEIFIARGSLKEPVEDISAAVDAEVKAQLQANSMTRLDQQILRNQIEEKLRAQQQVVGPNYARRWDIQLGFRKAFLRDQPLFLRLKFQSPETRPFGDPPTYRAFILVGAPDSPKLFRIDEPSVAAGTFHEWTLPPNLFNADGTLSIEFRNYNEQTLLFPLDEGLEVLYREGGFGLNFIRGLGILLCWLALLAAIGLCAASFLSFPVAAFFALTVLVLGLSTGTLTIVAEEGTVFGLDQQTQTRFSPLLDAVFVPVFRAVLKVVNLVQAFSPIDSLSTGRSITWGQLGLAWFQTVVVLGGVFVLFGITAFTRRELATAQTNAS